MQFLIKFWNRHKKVNLWILKFLLFFVLVYNLYSKFSGEEFKIAIHTFQNEFSFSKIHFLFIAIAFTFVNWGLETLKYYLTVQRVEKISYFRAYRGILYGNAMNLILPASIGELTGRPMVLKEENRAEGSGVAYYVSIVQKVASPFVGLVFFSLAVYFGFLKNEAVALGSFSFPFFQIIVAISLLDFLFWLFLFLKPSIILHLLERIQFLKRIFEKIENALDIKTRLKWQLIGIGSIRFVVFVTQYWFLMFLFFDHFPHFEFYLLCGVYFLAQFVIPSLGFLDLGVRANIVAIVFINFSENIVQLMAVNYLIWIINILIPSLFGFWLMRNNIMDTKEA